MQARGNCMRNSRIVEQVSVGAATGCLQHGIGQAGRAPSPRAPQKTESIRNRLIGSELNGVAVQAR